MSTTLICAPPGADPAAILQALAKEAVDASGELGQLNARLHGATSPDSPALLAELRSLLEPEGDAPVVAFDSATGATLGLLRDGLERPPLVVLVLAPPERCARRLAETGSSLPFGLASYERELRRLLVELDGFSVLVVEEDEAPVRVLAALAALSSDSASSIETPRRELGGAASSWLPLEIDQLWRVAATLRGGHLGFQSPRLPDESAWTTELLAASSELEQLGAALVFTAEQLATAVRAEPPTTGGTTRSSVDDDEEQFHEPEEGGPYRLNASEDRPVYHRWLTWHREPVVIGGLGAAPVRKAATRARRRRKSPLISVVVPAYRTPIWAIERCVGSVLAQRFDDWELCIADDGSADPELAQSLRSLARLDRRVTIVTSPQNGGISDATNRAIAATSGRFIAFLDHDDELAPQALGAIAAVCEGDPEADLIYSDEDKIDATGERFDPLFKPDWSPDLLLSFAYACHLTVIRRTLLDELGGLRSEFDGSQDYDLALRASERARRVVHVPEVLYHWRSIPGSAASDTSTSQAKPWAYEAGRRAIADALERRGEPAEVTMLEEFPGRYHVRRKVQGDPLVSIIIPFRDEPGLLATCARTLRSAPGYEHFELVLVDNGSELPETAALVEELAKEPGIRVLQAPGPFNWAAINNAAAESSSAELLLFMNNDIEARRPGWLDAMVGHAQRLEVGAVGARLVYPDGSIQHAGVVIGLGGIAGHVLRGLPGDVPGYNSMAIQTRDCSVVTGAAMMVRRDVFFEVGGFDEELAVAFNDVDFCLKLRERGYLVVFTPLAELVHHESPSRGHTDDFAESRRIIERWAPTLVVGDPYMNVHLSHWRYWCPLSTAQEDDRWRNYLETRVLMRDLSSSG